VPRVRKLWLLPILACFVLGVIALMPSSSGGSGELLPYQALMPWAPLTSIGIWVCGLLFYLLGRQITERPMRPWGK
jgi:hypothetical protein